MPLTLSITKLFIYVMDKKSIWRIIGTLLSFTIFAYLGTKSLIDGSAFEKVYGSYIFALMVLLNAYHVWYISREEVDVSAHYKLLFTIISVLAIIPFVLGVIYSIADNVEGVSGSFGAVVPLFMYAILYGFEVIRHFSKR